MVLWGKKMKVRIKRIDKSLPLPEYHSIGAAGFDIYARVDMTIAPHEVGHVPSNLVVETPEGYVLVVAARGSLFKRTGLMMANSVGIVDYDYRGDNDEIMLPLYNVTDKEAVIKKGERYAQGIFLEFEKGEWSEVDKMDNTDRGAFGSTGVK
jgi:dUTP pyrophosphatase